MVARTRLHAMPDQATDIRGFVAASRIIMEMRAEDAAEGLLHHGPESFVDRLCDAGFDANPLGRSSQKRLF
jgi:hypothetical protein